MYRDETRASPVSSPRASLPIDVAQLAGPVTSTWRCESPPSSDPARTEWPVWMESLLYRVKLKPRSGLRPAPRWLAGSVIKPQAGGE